MMRRAVVGVGGLALALAGAACAEPEPRAAVFPEPDSVSAWFGEGTEARLAGDVLELHGTVEPEHLRRGGSLWAQSGPYFYLFNVQVRDLLVAYPDLAGVRAVTYAGSGDEVARAMLPSRVLNKYEWQEALALASLAQREGTTNVRRIHDLIRWGEEHTSYRYAD